MTVPPEPHPRSHAPRLRAVVLGASAGGLQALGAIVSGLPAHFGLPLVVVQHLPASGVSRLPELFAGKTCLATREVTDKCPLRPATLYFAPADYHVLIEDDLTLSLSQDDAVLFSRPSIDVLFESAAEALGPAVAGVLLSGASEDGARGLQAIHEAGGLCIVQHPGDAQVRTMPESALRRFVPDHLLPAREIHGLLCQLGAMP